MSGALPADRHNRTVHVPADRGHHASPRAGPSPIDHPGTANQRVHGYADACPNRAHYQCGSKRPASPGVEEHAVEAPRFLIGRDPVQTDAGRMQIEDRIPRSILQDLIARGHRFQKIGRKGEVRQGYASAVVVDLEKREVQGGAEPRRSHQSAVPQ
jgi:hypothetical protein